MIGRTPLLGRNYEADAEFHRQALRDVMTERRSCDG